MQSYKETAIRKIDDTGDGFCLRTFPETHGSHSGPDFDVQQASQEWVEATVQALPIKPSKITNIQGPALEFTRVDAHTADIKIIHGFRAHFDGSMSGDMDACGEDSNCLVHIPDEKFRRKVLSRRSVSFSDLAELEAPTGALELIGRNQWEIDPAEIALGRRIAVGGFAEVFIGRYQGTVVAVKRLFDHDSDSIEKFKKEVILLAKLRHPNLILFMGYCLTPELSIVSEFMNKGCLYNILRKSDGIPMPDGYTEVVVVSVARAMTYLHSREPPILHLDLKSPNILIDNSWRVKITDFGLSRLRSRTVVTRSAAGNGTPHWMAPEAIRGEKVDEKCDVYSFGVIIWELLTGSIPWSNLNPIQVIAAVGFKNKKLPTPDHPNKMLTSLMDSCLSAEPTDRPSFSRIIQILDSYYSQQTDNKASALKLKLRGETEESQEPSSPMVGTMVEILTSDTGSKTLSASDRSVGGGSRTSEKLKDFEEKCKVEGGGFPILGSPFADFADTPLEMEDKDVINQQ